MLLTPSGSAEPYICRDFNILQVSATLIFCAAQLSFMTPRQERELLKKYGISEELSAEEVTQLLKKRATQEELEGLKKRYSRKMGYCAQAEQALREGNLRRAEELLEYALGLGIYGNEVVYNLLGDVYSRRGMLEKARECYRRSGSIESLKKLKNLG